MPPSALWSSRRRKSSLSLPKSVQIDESKNVVFSYQSGSTIEAFLPVAGTAGSGSSKHDIIHNDSFTQHEPIHIMDEATYNRLSTRDCLDWDLPYVGYPGYKAENVEYAKSIGTTVYTMSHTSATSPWRSLSSAAATSRTSSQSQSLENSTESLSSSSLSPSQTSWTPEAGGSLDSVLNGNETNTFANIASSLDTLWSPPMLRRTISEVPSARRRPRPTLSAPRGPAEAVGVGESTETGVRRVPMLRRQASMPSLEREMSEENPFLEQLPVWSLASSQPQESAPKIGATTDGKDPILAVQESTTSVKNECQEVVMADVESELPAGPLSASTTSTLVVSGSSKSNRGVIRRRDTRQLHHPYRRRASASTTTTSQDGSVDESLLRLPAQFRRSASFAGTTSTPPVPPVLRREVSTTAYMDIL
ncbi:hypothetical protein BGZ96_011930 [Linnemannia gamsii]|uniref:Uncharacterized protein n=1 Tax=Linnemannia gamsii TaxID=64522 RepID=A0ABQ7KBL9_9FUNG|nr:hypothetical protein BGZ96_011930 [Linnemannia gamsii]